MAGNNYTLGTVEASENLILDLYVDLRKKIALWANVTHQTAQARMGYVGQHLVSVVTGLKGGKSGARGYDLIHPEGGYSEIKTCYRVDQLGSCNKCEARIAAIEKKCSSCGSTDINRMDDSKWLIGIRNDEEFKEILSPKYYYLVLFEFVDLQNPDTIRSSIWKVDPKNPGFAYCMIDYYLNIRANSKSKAPFNLWPYELKFCLMRPILIYSAEIEFEINTISTKVFPGKDDPKLHKLDQLEQFSRSRNLTKDVILEVATAFKVKDKLKGMNEKRELLGGLQKILKGNNVSYEVLADAIAFSMYREKISPHLNENLPEKIRKAIGLK